MLVIYYQEPMMDTPVAGIFLIAIRKCPAWDVTIEFAVHHVFGEHVSIQVMLKNLVKTK